MDKYYYYQSYYEALKGLKASTRYAIREAIDKYMFEDEEPAFKDTLSNSIWMLLLPTLRLSKVRYANGKQTKSKDEAKPKQNESKPEANLKQSQSKVEGNPQFCSSISKEKGERRKDKGEEKKDKEKSANAATVARFIKPTLDQVKEYVAEKGYHFDAVAFHAFYESKGWRVGNQPMKSWEAACITWEKREPHPDVKEEVKQKPVPKVTQCPTCGSYELRITLDRVMCKSCGAVYDYNHTKAKWEAV